MAWKFDSMITLKDTQVKENGVMQWKKMILS